MANPKLFGEREEARHMLDRQPVYRPAPGTVIVTDKGPSGEDTEAFFARPYLGLTLVRPARKDEKAPRYFPTGCGSGWRRSSEPCRSSSASNATADASPPAYGAASSSGCWPSTPAFGTTGT